LRCGGLLRVPCLSSIIFLLECPSIVPDGMSRAYPALQLSRSELVHLAQSEFEEAEMQDVRKQLERQRDDIVARLRDFQAGAPDTGTGLEGDDAARVPGDPGERWDSCPASGCSRAFSACRRRSSGSRAAFTACASSAVSSSHRSGCARSPRPRRAFPARSEWS